MQLLGSKVNVASSVEVVRRIHVDCARTKPHPKLHGVAPPFLEDRCPAGSLLDFLRPELWDLPGPATSPPVLPPVATAVRPGAYGAAELKCDVPKCTSVRGTPYGQRFGAMRTVAVTVCGSVPWEIRHR